ncbi:phytanoyl-CoA dioxygenase family protein [Aquihabitans sp. G128]|uniref:phytanoyl-CoA dioxygenase family protein n=1 Tax=Aquihabitans sp. G128 TaxID=2849779 RepID=UPI001C2240D9|nr:phytanoyl-CoA dioxygenase family protein [Aquihabitans sp. G128]QXC60300.1 phytanoyl-CoA dioxygenase family protein [Aquihabitans sp. G128]
MPQAEGVPTATVVEPTFRDAERQAAFERDGVFVTPVLEPGEAAALRQAIVDILPTSPWDFIDLLRNNPPTLRKQVGALVREALEPKVAAWFVDHDFWAASILAKPPGPGGIIHLHTDWTFVDERRYRTGLVWVALDDMTLRNGAIVVAPGTNRLDPGFRGQGIHYPYSDPAVRQAIDDRSVLLDVPAGQAVVWEHRLLHGSNENTTDDLRLAVGLAFRPRGAQLLHYRLMPDGQAHRYRVDPEFLTHYDAFTEVEELTGPHLAEDGVHPMPTWAPTPDDLRGLGPVHPIHGAAAAVAPPRHRRFRRRSRRG